MQSSPWAAQDPCTSPRVSQKCYKVCLHHPEMRGGQFKELLKSPPLWVPRSSELHWLSSASRRVWGTWGEWEGGEKKAFQGKEGVQE